MDIEVTTWCGATETLLVLDEDEDMPPPVGYVSRGTSLLIIMAAMQQECGCRKIRPTCT